MNIWNNNLNILEHKYPVIAAAVRENKIDENEQDEILDIRLDSGEYILGVKNNGYCWRLNSILNPVCTSEIYAEQYLVRAYCIFFVFGFGDGRQVRELLKKCDITNRIIVVEPNIHIFQKSVQLFELGDVIGDDRVSLCIPDIEDTLDKFMDLYVEYSRIKLVEFCILPAYDVLYPEKCEKVIRRVSEDIDIKQARENTYTVFNRTLPQNILFNMQQSITQRNLVQAKRALNKFNLKNIPAIIVSAGPSLDKNIKDLKQAEKKAFIIVVDAALRAVLNAGIWPDLVCTIDPKVPERFIENLDVKNLNWCCDRQSKPWVLQHGQKVVFYYGWFNSMWNEEMEKMSGYKYPKLESEGAVSTEAFQIVCELGFEKIILIGQDLAFTNGKSHTKGIAGALGDNDEYIKKRQLVKVEGINGEILETDYQMSVYRRWFEKRIEELKGKITVIDATEGGAKIEGARIERLCDTIQRECTQQADFYQLLHEIPPAFDEKQQKILTQQLYSLKVKMQDFKEIMDNVISDLKQQKMLLQANTGNVSVIKSVLQKVFNINQKYSEDSLMEWLVMYSQEAEHRLKESIYLDENIEPLDLLERTLELYQSYRESIDLFFEDYAEYIS